MDLAHAPCIAARGRPDFKCLCRAAQSVIPPVFLSGRSAPDHAAEVCGMSGALQAKLQRCFRRSDDEIGDKAAEGGRRCNDEHKGKLVET